MKKYIDADSLSKFIADTRYKLPHDIKDFFTRDNMLLNFEQYVGFIPPSDVTEVRHGRWLNFYGEWSAAECDLCGECYEVSPDEEPKEEYFKAFNQAYKYCPHCGAKMDKEAVDG